MTISQQDFESILADDTKQVTGDITWTDDDDHSPALEFRAEVESDTAYSLFVVGKYNPLAGKLSYAFIRRGVGRIYALDLGSEHRNPDGRKVGEMHKHKWRHGYRENFAYIPSDITQPWDRPIEVWNQFCAQAKLHHNGAMRPPDIQEELLP